MLLKSPPSSYHPCARHTNDLILLRPCFSVYDIYPSLDKGFGALLGTGACGGRLLKCYVLRGTVIGV